MSLETAGSTTNERLVGKLLAAIEDWADDDTVDMLEETETGDREAMVKLIDHLGNHGLKVVLA